MEESKKTNPIIPILLMVIFAALIAGGILFYRYQEKERERRAVEAFKKAGGIESIRDISDDYSDKVDDIMDDMTHRE